MKAITLTLGASLALVAACSTKTIETGTTGPGGAGSSSSATATSGSGGLGGSSTSSTTSTSSSSTTGSTSSAGAGGGCAIDPTFAEVLSKPLSGCAGLEPPCHNHDAAMLHIDPTDAAGTWASFVNVDATVMGAGKRVVPGDPAHSFAYRKLTNKLTPDELDPMPLNGLSGGWTELPADQIEIMRCWILAGAKNN